VASVNK